MHSQTPHPDMTLVVRKVQSLAWSESTKVWAAGNFQVSLLGDMFLYQLVRGFLSRSVFRTLYYPRSELHPLIFAEEFARCRYQSL